MAGTRRARFLVYPTKPQRVMLARTFGSCRVVWNDALGIFLDAFKAGLPTPSFGEVAKEVTTEAKRTPERKFLADVSSVALVQSLNDLLVARNNYFASLAGRRHGRSIGAPRFKSKRGKQSARFGRKGFSLRPNGRLYLAKIGDLRVRWSLKDRRGQPIRLPATPSSVTVIRSSSGKYFVSFCYSVETDEARPETPLDTGIDLGLRDFAVLRDGKAVSNPKFFEQGRVKLTRLQRAHARTDKGSKRREKLRVKIARQHERISAQRDDFLEQLSTRIVRDNQAVYVEGLSVLGLSRGQAAKSVQDAAWGKFLTLLRQKCDRYGRDFVAIDRFFPSTRMCSSCGELAGPRGQRELKIRSWSCPCGITHNRDRNAEINIRREGRRVMAERLHTKAMKLAEGRSSADLGAKPESLDAR